MISNLFASTAAGGQTNWNIRRFVPQPLIAILVSGLALTLVVLSSGGRILPSSVVNLHGLIMLALIGGVVLAEQFPVHIGTNTKIQMTTIPLYVLVVLFPPATAAIAVGIAQMLGAISVNKVKGNYPSDIATDACRWIIAATIGSAVIRLVEPHIGNFAAFAVGGEVLWFCDMMSAPLTLAPMSGEHPWSIVKSLIREAGPSEAAQYVIGLVAVVLASTSLWLTPLLLIPAVAIHMATQRTKELHNSTQNMLENLADTVDLRDAYTGGHSRRVTEYAKSIIDQMGLQGPEVKLIITAARLHDIGKIAVPDDVLNKPGKLTDEERAVMSSHPEVGADFLEQHPGFRRGVAIVRHHHESWDGTGYPHKLKETEIPFGARIIAVADSYDAMTSDRPYRSGMPVRKAVSILREGRGVQWDPRIVDAFIKSIAGAIETDEAPRLHIVRNEDGVVPAALSA